MAANFTMGIWMDAVDMATVGVGIRLTCVVVVMVVCKGWAITLTLHLLFTGALVLLFLSAILGPGVFLVMQLFFLEGVLVHGCD